MARDRKRAKQRQRQRQRREHQHTARVQSKPTTTPPDPVEDASADAELAQEAVVEGADGPVAELRPEELPQPDELEGIEAPEEGVEPDAEPDAEVEPELEAEPGEEADAFGHSSRRRAAARPRPTGDELPKEGNRLVNFLRACAAELRRVQWPDRQQVSQATGVVLGFVVIAGAYLGLLDAVFSRLVNAIL